MLTSAASNSSRRNISASLAGVDKISSLSMPRVNGAAFRYFTEPRRNFFSAPDILFFSINDKTVFFVLRHVDFEAPFVAENNRDFAPLKIVEVICQNITVRLKSAANINSFCARRPNRISESQNKSDEIAPGHRIIFHNADGLKNEAAGMPNAFNRVELAGIGGK